MDTWFMGPDSGNHRALETIFCYPNPRPPQLALRVLTSQDLRICPRLYSTALIISLSNLLRSRPEVSDGSASQGFVAGLFPARLVPRTGDPRKNA